MPAKISPKVLQKNSLKPRDQKISKIHRPSVAFRAGIYGKKLDAKGENFTYSSRQKAQVRSVSFGLAYLLINGRWPKKEGYRRPFGTHRTSNTSDTKNLKILQLQDWNLRLVLPQSQSSKRASQSLLQQVLQAHRRPKTEERRNYQLMMPIVEEEEQQDEENRSCWIYLKKVYNVLLE